MIVQKKTLETSNLIVSCDEEFLIIELKEKPSKGLAKKITIPQSFEVELLELIKQTSPNYKPPAPIIPQPAPMVNHPAPMATVPTPDSQSNTGPVGEEQNLVFTDVNTMKKNIIKQIPYNEKLK